MELEHVGTLGPWLSNTIRHKTAQAPSRIELTPQSWNIVLALVRFASSCKSLISKQSTSGKVLTS